MKLPSIYTVRKYKVEKCKWIETEKTKVIIRPWVKFLRWLFSDQWTEEKDSFYKWYNLRLENTIESLEKMARSRKEDTMHRRLTELGYTVQCNINATIHPGIMDPEELIENSEWVDPTKPLFEVVKKDA